MTTKSKKESLKKIRGEGKKSTRKTTKKTNNTINHQTIKFSEYTITDYTVKDVKRSDGVFVGKIKHNTKSYNVKHLYSSTWKVI